MIDLVEQVSAIHRQVVEGEREGHPTRAVLARREYAAAIEDVWSAVTTADRLRRWFLPISGDLVVGGRFQFEGNAGGEILYCEPPRVVRTTWEAGGGVSWLEVGLEEGGGGTTLQLTHTAVVDPLWTEYGPGAVGVGWDLGLLGLADHLAGGPDVAPGFEEQLMASAEGRAYVEASSTGWARADVEAGAEPEQAERARRATHAFYTGAA